MQGNLIDEAEAESLFHEIRTKFITPVPCRVRRLDAPLPPTAAQSFRKDLFYWPQGHEAETEVYPHLAEYNKQDVTEKI